MKRVHTARKEGGFTLNEALISLTVLTSGLLALAQFQGDLHENRRSTKLQTTAANLALEKLEEIRHQASADFASLADGHDRPSAGGQMDFERRWTVKPHLDPAFAEVEVITDWQSSDGAPRSSVIRSLVTASQPYGEQQSPTLDPGEEKSVETDEGEGEMETPASNDTLNRNDLVRDAERTSSQGASQTSATCLCVREPGASQAVPDTRGHHPQCSSACCETTWRTAHGGDCERESCNFVARCGSS